MVRRFLDFVKRDIWRMRLKEQSGSKTFFIHQLRVVVLAVRGFDEDKCMLRASALTFYSLLSIVPVMAMVFGIAKGFGFENRIEQELYAKFEGQEEIINRVIVFARNLLEKTSGGFIAGVGTALLLWSIIKVLGNIEKSFNHIWGIPKDRPWGRKVSDYLFFMFVSPLLLIMSSSITVFITSQVTAITEKITAISAVAPLLLFGLRFLPFVVIWILFTFIYIFMPNTKVRFRSALVAGVAAGTLFQLAQWVYVTFQIGAAKYGAIYGSFAALPLFLVWLQTSWLIVLFGAEISFAHQNVQTYEFEQETYSVSHSFKMLLSLAVTRLLVKNFCRGEKPADATGICAALDIPIRLVRQILFELAEAQIICEVKKDEDKSICYLPARDVGTITISYVVGALQNHGSSSIPVIESAELNRLRDALHNFENLIEKSPANVSLKDI